MEKKIGKGEHVMKARFLITTPLIICLFCLVGYAFAASGDLVVNGQIISKTPEGTSPLVISSTTPVKNLVAQTADSLTMQGEAAALFGLVTVSSSTTYLTSVDLGQVTAGDFIDATLTLKGKKGALAGLVTLVLQRSAESTAQIGTCLASNNYFGDSATIDANSSFSKTLAPHIRVNTTGTLVLEAYAVSAGSNTTSATGALGVAFKKKQ